MGTKQEPSPPLTIEQCYQLATAMLEDAAALPPGPKKEKILELAYAYRNLAEIKGWVFGIAN
jgi:hypothetical protein